VKGPVGTEFGTRALWGLSREKIRGKKLIKGKLFD